jgi:hypothetical protein
MFHRDFTTLSLLLSTILKNCASFELEEAGEGEEFKALLSSLSSPPRLFFCCGLMVVPCLEAVSPPFMEAAGAPGEANASHARPRTGVCMRRSLNWSALLRLSRSRIRYSSPVIVYMYVCVYVYTCYVLTKPPIPSSRCKCFVFLRPV